MRNLAKSKSIQEVLAAGRGAGDGGRALLGATAVKFLWCSAVFQTKVQRSHLNPNPEVGSTPFNLWASSNHHSLRLAPATAALAVAPTAAGAAKWEIHFLFKFWRKTEQTLPRVPTQSYCCCYCYCWVFQWCFRREEDECCATDNTMTPIVFQLLLSQFVDSAKTEKEISLLSKLLLWQRLSYLRLRSAFEILGKRYNNKSSLRYQNL